MRESVKPGSVPGCVAILALDRSAQSARVPRGPPGDDARSMRRQ
jgi:hypothetical protein